MRRFEISKLRLVCLCLGTKLEMEISALLRPFCGDKSKGKASCCRAANLPHAHFSDETRSDIRNQNIKDYTKKSQKLQYHLYLLPSLLLELHPRQIL